VNIHNIIAAINPKLYCATGPRNEVAATLRTGLSQHDRFAYLKAAALAQPVEPNGVSLEQLQALNPFRLPGFQSPTEQRTLNYENIGDSVEALYFSLLDEITSHDSWQVTKLVDSFVATPGSGLFGDLTRRQTQMQQEALKTLANAHQRAQHIFHLLSEIKRQSEDKAGPADPIRQEQIDRHLLRSLVDGLKLQVRWIKPLLTAARQLGQSAKPTAELVTVFNSVLFELTLLAQGEYRVKEAVDRGDLPAMFKKAQMRIPHPVLIIEFRVRAVPERIPGGYGFRGRTEVRFTSYALTEEEIHVLHREVERSELREIFDVLNPRPMPDLDTLVQDIELLLAEPIPEQQPGPAEDTNPFSALLSIFDSSGSESPHIDQAQDEFRPIKPDTELEAVLRSETILEARRHCQRTYQETKRLHRMVGL